MSIPIVYSQGQCGTVIATIQRRSSKTWAAKIVGESGQFGLERVFLKDRAADAGVAVYQLDDGGHYEIASNGRRSFVCVSGGAVTEATKELILKRLLVGALTEWETAFSDLRGKSPDYVLNIASAGSRIGDPSERWMRPLVPRADTACQHVNSDPNVREALMSIWQHELETLRPLGTDSVSTVRDKTRRLNVSEGGPWPAREALKARYRQYIETRRRDPDVVAAARAYLDEARSKVAPCAEREVDALIANRVHYAKSKKVAKLFQAPATRVFLINIWIRTANAETAEDDADALDEVACSLQVRCRKAVASLLDAPATLESHLKLKSK